MSKHIGKIIMKRIFICLLFFMPGCYNTSKVNSSAHLSFKTIGSHSSDQTWVYLCGLITEFIPEYMDELSVLDRVGKKFNIKFLAMIPTKRCPQLNNKLCWPQETQEELLQTYKEIDDAMRNYDVQGFIGFSNGGFFINKLAQFIEMDKPFISIGAAGPLLNKQGPFNAIYLLIGRQDQWHYEHAINLYNNSKGTNLSINLIEYDGGHELPELILSELIRSFV